jgi:hypothetical protein
MKKLTSAFLVLLPLVLASAEVQAFWFGSPGSSLGQRTNSIQMIYDTGSREIEPSTGGIEIDMDTDRLYFQYSRGLGNGLEFFGRIMPETGEADFENSTFSPDLFGFGGGIHWAPKQQGAVKFGVQASLDWNQGDDANVDIDIKEMVIAGGGSYRVNKNVDAYGGLSLLKSDITIEPPAGPDQDWENSNTFGIYGGFTFRPGPNFNLGVELHLINESIFGFSGSFKF